VVLKLIPEVIIYGEVKNEIGEPVEGVTVRAQRWQAEVGQKQLRNFGEGVTDDEGKFRIAELKPGKYQLAFLPGNRGGWSVISKLRRREQAAQGYGVQFYPGVQDPALAMGIELRAGAKFHVSQTLSRERLYEIAGVVRGASSASGSSVSLMDAEGNIMQRIVRMDPKTGEFQIPGIPAGTYLLSAMGFDETQNGGNTPATTRLRATLPVHVKSDLAGVVLTLGQGISVGVRVDDEAPTDEEGNVHQVFVRLISKEFPQYSPGTQVPPHGDERLEPKIDDILPGTYTVEAMLNHSGYIASLRSGHTDLLRDELTVAPGTVPPPIEVTVRTDGAQLSVTTLENGVPAAAGVVLYSQEYPRRSLASQSNELGKLSMAGIPPGQYEVIAVRNAQDLEFLNPASMEKYMEHAVAVTLHSNDEASVRVEVQEPEEQEQ